MRIDTTEEFDEWLDQLKNSKDRARIISRIRQCDLAGKPVGDINSVGKSVAELRFHFGPGYRVYFVQKGDILMLLLAGGTKRGQQADINHAHDLLSQLKEEHKW
ncbi:type II toxin-antitoxin system RelE/ParE family toxin [Bifidobacterium saguinibicoloris]|uniref:type II toxin-antitoxin system RelE/ParE family toxin n=1 Tax=Bifidobacterium saguinibicoloris TaxID=2834433 RepID=UPI001C577F30|nr:type II toxin-antitoxin system RelE/ParE family toxin [Bifidobacterium saguinibicoloris]MBW3079885.1 type II toxin-antitoxin system RelE/ParE family toxin [Bifidobacterium saguinibicoloris]